MSVGEFDAIVNRGSGDLLISLPPVAARELAALLHRTVDLDPHLLPLQRTLDRKLTGASRR